MKPKTVTRNLNRNPRLAARVERALVRAEESARRTARIYGTPFYLWENGDFPGLVTDFSIHRFTQPLSDFVIRVRRLAALAPHQRVECCEIRALALFSKKGRRVHR
jgi:hypothetical protein